MRLKKISLNRSMYKDQVKEKYGDQSKEKENFMF